MQLGMIGLGRMGGNMALRLLRAGHQSHVYSIRPPEVQAMEAQGAKGSTTIDAFVGSLAAPRAIWLMLPAAAVIRSSPS
jgi:6-phosphogluconate dehydrogenase